MPRIHLGWFGGGGFDATLQFFQHLGIPAVFGVMAIFAEFFGGLMVLLGFFTRLGAAVIAIDMAVTLVTVHLPQGFFIGGGKVGFEYVFALLLMALEFPNANHGGHKEHIDFFSWCPLCSLWFLVSEKSVCK